MCIRDRLSSGQKSGEISEQEAKTDAFAHAGVSESDIVALKVSKGTEDAMCIRDRLSILPQSELKRIRDEYLEKYLPEKQEEAEE